MRARKLPPVHPGLVLQDEFLAPLGISQAGLARNITVPPKRINDVVKGRRGITGDIALRLARYFGVSAQFWMNLQTRYDLDVAQDALKGRLKKEVRIHAA